MKNQFWGRDAFTLEPLYIGGYYGHDAVGACDRYMLRTHSLLGYEEKRKNGAKKGHVPGDGKYEWIKGRVEGNSVYGVKESDGNYHYEICYNEGPKDKEWMEEGDREYIYGLLHDGNLLKIEPNADKEISPNHKYLAEITRALKAARAGCKSLEELDAADKEAKTQVDRASKAAEEAKGCETNVSQLLAAIKERVNTASVLVDKIKHFSGVGTDIVSAANMAMAEIERQTGLAKTEVQEITKQAAIAAIAAQKATAQIRENPTAVIEITKQADEAARAALEAKKQLDFGIVTAALEGVKNGVTLVLEIFEERTKKEAKNQEDGIRHTATEIQRYPDSAIALIKELTKQLEVVTNIVSEIEATSEIYSAVAVDRKKQSDINLSIKLKMQLKAASPIVSEVKKQLEVAISLEEELKNQVAVANDALQKAEAERRTNPLAVTAIAAQGEIATKALVEAKRLMGVGASALEETKRNVASAQKAKEQGEQEIQNRQALAERKAKEQEDKEARAQEAKEKAKRDQEKREAEELKQRLELEKLKERKVTIPQSTAISWIKIPESFICPITQELMVDPVMAADGHTYERKAIEKWLFECQKRISPLTGERLVHTILTPNHTLKCAIAEFQEQLPEIQKRQIEQDRKRLEDTNFRVALKVREEEIESHIDIVKVKQKVHDEERCELQERIAKLGLEKEKLTAEIAKRDSVLQAKAKELEQAEELADSLQNDKKTLEKKLEQAQVKSNSRLIATYHKQLEDLQRQLVEAQEEKSKIAADHHKLEDEQAESTRQNTKMLKEIQGQISRLTGKVDGVQESVHEVGSSIDGVRDQLGRERKELEEEVRRLQVENETLKGKIIVKENNLEEKTQALAQAEETIAAIREDKESFEKKLEQALSKNNTRLAAMCQTRLDDLMQQLKETEHDRKILEEERKGLELERTALAEQNQKLLGEISAKMGLLTESVQGLKDQLAEESAIEQDVRRRQEQLLQELEEKLEEYGHKESLSGEERSLLEELQSAKRAELEKIEQRNKLLEQQDYPQLKEFYLSIQCMLNIGLKADEMESSGEFATRDTTKKEKAANAAKIIGRFIPLAGILLNAAGTAVKAYAEKSKQAKGQYISKLAPDTLSREAMVEEIAFGLCVHYKRQLQGLSLFDENERKNTINRLAEVAVTRIRGYLQQVASVEPDPVKALVRAVRVTKIKKDRKIIIIKKSAAAASASAANADTPELWLDRWTAHGFFSQSGIRTDTPRRRRFAAEAPKPADTNKKHTNFTDVNRYGYAHDTEEAAIAAGMALRS